MDWTFFPYYESIFNHDGNLVSNAQSMQLLTVPVVTEKWKRFKNIAIYTIYGDM